MGIAADYTRQVGVATLPPIKGSPRPYPSAQRRETGYGEIRSHSMQHRCQSLTFDRGTEFAGFRALDDGIGARSWFCDPSAPWQKEAVENANKRIRRFLPANTDLTHLPQATLDQLARMLNDRPKKCLGYKTPAEVFVMHLQAQD